MYCGHNVLYWLPALRYLGLLRCRIVSLLFAREPLEWSRGHSGVVALTRAAAEHARKLAPGVRVAHLGWGADLSTFPQLPYAPEWFLSCGRTLRDHDTLCAAATESRQPVRVVCPRPPAHLKWPQNVNLMTRGGAEDVLGYTELLREQYGSCAGSLIILRRDDAEYTAVGMTNLIEAMAMGRPVIVTKTGALPTELDVEHAGCGLHVPPGDARALADAMDQIARSPGTAALMGAKGRSLCETHYNMRRYACELHRFFEEL